MTNRGITLQEFEENLFPKTRAKIEAKLDGGWTFDAAAAYCRSFNTGGSTNSSLVKIYNQYQK